MRNVMPTENEQEEYVDIPAEQQTFTFTFTATENLEQELNE